MPVERRPHAGNVLGWLGDLEVQLDQRETRLLFEIMSDLSADFEHAEVRLRMGRRLLELLRADYFASYVWDDDAKRFVDGVYINMDPANLQQYEDYFQFRDPITSILHKRDRATPVSQVMEHGRLRKTEFFNDFLMRDGLCYGLNYYARHCGRDVGDLRVWRKAGREDFTLREAGLVDSIGPSIANAFERASRMQGQRTGHAPSFATQQHLFDLSRREAQIADLLTTGRTDAELCDTLGIAMPTLRTHVGNIFRKTGLSRRSQLSALLLERNHQF